MNRILLGAGPDPHQSQKPDPDPHQSQNSKALEAPKGATWWAVDANNGGVEGCRPVVVDLHHFGEELDPDPH